MAIGSYYTVTIKSSDGLETLWSESLDGNLSYKVAESGLVADSYHYYTYNGNKEFQGLAISPNSIIPEYAIGEYVYVNSEMTLYVVEKEKTKVSKVVFGGETLIDLTADTVTAEKLVTGTTAHDAAGNQVTGSNPYEKTATDSTVATQTDLLEQLRTSLEGKAAGGGGTGNSVKYATGTFTPPETEVTGVYEFEHNCGFQPHTFIVYVDSFNTNAYPGIYFSMLIRNNNGTFDGISGWDDAGNSSITRGYRVMGASFNVNETTGVMFAKKATGLDAVIYIPSKIHHWIAIG